MNKKELTKQISERSGNTQVATLQFIKTFMDIVTEEIRQGNAIFLQGFGRFVPWKQTTRMARNPKTGEAVEITSRKSIKFKPSKILRSELNKPGRLF